jgi:hypothetical protein
LFTAGLWLALLLIRHITIADGVVGTISIFIALFALLFPSIKRFYEKFWFSTPITTTVISFFTVGGMLLLGMTLNLNHLINANQSINASQPIPILPQNHVSMGSDLEGSVSGSEIEKYSHFPPLERIKYTRISADDDISTVELVCTEKSEEITSRFHPLPKPQYELFPQYKSDVIDVSPGCRIDFTLVNTSGESAMTFDSSQ